MQYARLKQQFKCDITTWNLVGNIGDCIQNLAVDNLYREFGIPCKIKINHNAITDYKGEMALLPMQGWFGSTYNVFTPNWSENVVPVFVGFHLNDRANCREIFEEKKIYEKMKKFQPIGCRDRNTRDYLKSLGLDAYFSGCLTLTFPRRTKEPENGKIFVVDLTPKAKNILPEAILKQADFSITHNYKFDNYPISDEEAEKFENCAREILKKYKDEAKLVITSRIHAAMPCLAMGIPVIYISDFRDESRLDVLNGILPKYTPEDARIINWNPKAPNIENLKKAIKNNAEANILASYHNYSYDKKLSSNNSFRRLQQQVAILDIKHRISDIYLKIKRILKKIYERYKIYEILHKNKPMVFWGASLFLEEFLKKYHIKNKNVLGIIDKNPEKCGKFLCGYEIFAPEDLAKLQPDCVVFAIANNSFEIYKEVESYLSENYPKIKLLPDLFN